MGRATDSLIDDDQLPALPSGHDPLDDILGPSVGQPSTPQSPQDFVGMEMPAETFDKYLSSKGLQQLTTRSAKMLRTLSADRGAEFAVIAHISDDKLCELVASGLPMAVVCKHLKVSLWALLHHIGTIEGLDERLAVAEKIGAESLVGSALIYLENAVYSESMEQIAASKNYAEFARWYAGAKNPSRYGTANERYNPGATGPQVSISVNVSREQADRSNATVIDATCEKVEVVDKGPETLSFSTSDFIKE